MRCPNAPGPCNCTGACFRREEVGLPWRIGDPPPGGFSATPSMADIHRLQNRCHDLEVVVTQLFRRVRRLEMPDACPQCGHVWLAADDTTHCPIGIGGGEVCGCPVAWHHQ